MFDGVPDSVGFDDKFDGVLEEETAFKLYKTEISPKNLVSDAADAIRNGLYSVFPDATLDVMCATHVLRNVRQRKFAEKAHKEQIIDNIRKMQLVPSSLEFDVVSKLFLQKWNNVEPAFCEYFNKQWLGVHKNWFEGCAEYTPSTNNGQFNCYNISPAKILFHQTSLFHITISYNDFVISYNDFVISNKYFIVSYNCFSQFLTYFFHFQRSRSIQWSHQKNLDIQRTSTIVAIFQYVRKHNNKRIRRVRRR